MSEEKQDTALDKVKIKQTRHKPNPIRLRDDAINKVKKSNIEFGPKAFKDIPFIVSKDTHQKGLMMRVYKGAPGDDFTKRVFYVRFWFNRRSDLHNCGNYSQSFGVNELNEYLIELDKTHKDRKTGLWIKNPNTTKKDEKRFVEKPDTTTAKGYTVNEIIEAYAGKVKKKVLEPNKVKEFSPGIVFNEKHDITVHEVEDTQEGMQSVRDIVSSHWGQNSNPWCITQTKNGKLTDDAWSQLDSIS